MGLAEQITSHGYTAKKLEVINQWRHMTTQTHKRTHAHTGTQTHTHAHLCTLPISSLSGRGLGVELLSLEPLRFPFWSQAPPELMSKCPWARHLTLHCLQWFVRCQLVGVRRMLVSNVRRFTSQCMKEWTIVKCFEHLEKRYKNAIHYYYL